MSTQAWDRLGSLDPGSLTGESKRLYDDIVSYFSTPYTYKLPDGQLIGPFGIELHTPGPGYAWLGMTQSLAAIKELPALAREVAILVTGTHEKAGYEVYAHSAVSQLDDQDLKQVLSGQCPQHFDAKTKMAFDLATALCQPGVLPAKLWQESIDVLGREATIAVVHYVGFYKYVATILNGFDARVPSS